MKDKAKRLSQMNITSASADTEDNTEALLMQKIEGLGIHDDIMDLHNAGLKPVDITFTINSLIKVPYSNAVSEKEVKAFLIIVKKSVPAAINVNTDFLARQVDNQFSMLDEVHDTYNRTKKMLNLLERKTIQNDKLDALAWKAIVSELREFLCLIKDINDDMAAHENMKKFMSIVVEVLMEECPDKLPIIAERLRVSSSTQWFSDMFGKKRGRY
jgi:hypothetical protein